MARWILAYLLFSCVAFAAPSNGLHTCLNEKLSAMAQAAAKPAGDIPGVSGETAVSAVLVDGKATDVKVTKSSGNSALDDVAVNCIQALDFAASMSGTGESERGTSHAMTMRIAWQTVLASARPDHSETHPFSIGAPHMCMSDYPPHLIRRGVTGTAGLIFNITIEGKVSGIMIAASSGNDELDRVSIGCARRWLYGPGLRDGAPVEQTNMALVEYAVSPAEPPWSPPMAIWPPRNCVRDAPVGAELMSAVTGPTIVAYKLILGQVTDVKLKKSSGNADLDSRASSCVASWRFEAANRRGEPATHGQIAVIDWHEAVVK